MALTLDTLKKSSILSTLTPEQLGEITKLSATDENSTIGAKVGEIHGAYEKDIFELTGIEKNQGEKAYDYNKRVMSKYKTSLDEKKTALEALKAEKVELEEKIKNGSKDEALKTQLAAVSKELTDARSAITAKDELLANKETEYKNKLNDIKIDSYFQRESAGLKFKAAYSPTIANTLLGQAKQDILNKYTPDFTIDASGNESIIFRDKQTNEIVRNPENGQNPYTVNELFGTTVLKEAIDTGRKQPGGGTGNFEGGKGGSSSVDLSSAKSQKEADDAIYSHLMEKGLVRGTQEFASEQTKLRTENEVEKLPIR